MTRLGDRIRVGGTAELAGYTLQLHEARERTLKHVVTDLFPAGGDVARAEDSRNSGSNLLYQGGEQWATSRGYYIEEGPGSSRTSWGQF